MTTSTTNAPSTKIVNTNENLLKLVYQYFGDFILVLGVVIILLLILCVACIVTWSKSITNRRSIQMLTEQHVGDVLKQRRNKIEQPNFMPKFNPQPSTPPNKSNIMMNQGDITPRCNWVDQPNVTGTTQEKSKPIPSVRIQYNDGNISDYATDDDKKVGDDAQMGVTMCSDDIDDSQSAKI